MYLLGSTLGWIIGGRIDKKDTVTTGPNMLAVTYSTPFVTEMSFLAPDASLPIDPHMEQFWNLETIGICEPNVKSDSDIAMDKFNKTVQIVNGRYEVAWPWKDDHPDLPTNYSLAYNRFCSLSKKLAKNPDMLKKYDAIIQEQVKLGIVEKVTEKSKEGQLKHYIPHHPVETPSKATTKVRIVYDASSKLRKENKSLNECL